MTNENLDYYRRRAEEELAAAERASDTAIAQIHHEMARRYRAQLSGGEPMHGNMGRVQLTGAEFAEPRPACA